MADNPRSHRPFNPPLRHGDADDQRGGGDPLAELARLIGQDDPFADFERNHIHREARDSAPAPAPPQDTQSYAYEAPAAPGYAADMAPQGADMAPQGYASHEHGPHDPAEAYDQYQDPAYAYPADPDQDPYQEGYQPYYDPYYDPDGGFDETEYLEQLERSRRRRRLAVVAALLAVAVLGGAGAYGYYAIFGSPMEASPPPVIKADANPTKVIPDAQQAGDTGSNKLIYDRVGEGGQAEQQAEKVVPREEKPVDIKTATVTPASRMTYPAPDAKVATAPPTATIPVTAQGTSGQVLPVASEPSIAVKGSGAILPSAKKVRTVTIRPDMTIVPNSAARVAEPEPPPAAQPESPATAASPQQDAAPAPSPAPTPARPTPPPQVANAPLSLSPDTVSSVPAQQAPARAASPGATEQPVALATAPAAGGDTPPATTDGRYTVQVSSQRSEAEAEAAYRTLQARYPNVLGEQPSFVRRADLGNRGIYYRTLVGPFATAEQAGQLCSALKAAGGQCIIHRN